MGLAEGILHMIVRIETQRLDGESPCHYALGCIDRCGCREDERP